MTIKRTELPECGPRMVFFSGGTACQGLASELLKFTHNSTYLVTTFDSGGSSATLREAFNMPAPGDLRNRLMALADGEVAGNREVCRLLRTRLARDQSLDALFVQLELMAKEDHKLMLALPVAKRAAIAGYLGYFLSVCPASFQLQGASIGNLVMAAAYLNNGRGMAQAASIFAGLVDARGTVRGIVDDSLHLGARLLDGTTVLGQHRLTGKEYLPIESAIESVFLTPGVDDANVATAKLPEDNRKRIEVADLIIYPPGSFYSSLLANFLPQGVGSAIAGSACPKVYLPNLGSDPEQFGMSFDLSIQQLLAYLRAGDEYLDTKDVLNYVLVDRQAGYYPFDVTEHCLQERGIQLIDTPLVTSTSAPYYDNGRVLEALLSFV